MMTTYPSIRSSSTVGTAVNRHTGRLLAMLGIALGSALALAQADVAMAADATVAPPQRELAVCADPSNLPYSNAREEGFENRIARLIADDLHASLRYTWNMQRRGFLRRTLKTGACDVVMGVPAELEGVAATRPYYTSAYVFVSARSRSLHLHDFDDPALKRLKIGLQALGAEGANTPPAGSLAARGIVDHIVGYSMWGEEDVESPQAKIIDAVASGEVDTAIVWGPLAGYFAKRYADRLEVTPVTGDPKMPMLEFTYDMSLGVRKGDEALKAELQAVLDRRRDDIQAILKEFGVPLVAAASAVSVQKWR